MYQLSRYFRYLCTIVCIACAYGVHTACAARVTKPRFGKECTARVRDN